MSISPGSTPEINMEDVASMLEAPAPESPGTPAAIESGPTVSAPPPMPTEITIDGKQYNVERLRQALRGEMMQADYTRKTTATKRWYEGEQAKFKDMQALYDDLRANPSLVEYIRKYYQQGQAGQGAEDNGEQPPFDPTRHPAFQSLNQQVRSLTSMYEEQQTSEATKILQTDLTDLRSKFPSLPWDQGFEDEVLEAVGEMDRRPSEVIWSERFRERVLEAQRQTWMRELQDNAKKKREAAVEPGSPRAMPGKDVKSLNKNELDRELLDAVKASGLGDFGTG